MRNTPECIMNLIMFIIVHPQYCYDQSIDYTINHPSIHSSLSLSLSLSGATAGDISASLANQLPREDTEMLEAPVMPHTQFVA